MGVQQVIRADNSGIRWCILRTSAARTITLAKSLAAAGFEVWTPIQIEKRRAARNSKTPAVDHEQAIMPTFIFARTDGLADLAAIVAMPVSPHPPFSIFHYGGRVPLIADREIEGLRAAEERAHRARRKTERHVFAKGSAVRVTEGSFGGMAGIVQDGDGKFALVGFGGSFRVKIATFLLRTDEVQKLAA